MSETTQSLTWYIRSDRRGFKMNMPFESIEDVKIVEVGPTLHRATITIGRPPHFSLEDFHPQNPTQRIWKPVSDWTEGCLASAVMSHCLVGQSPQFVQLLRLLQANVQSFAGHNLGASPMDIPAPPMAGLTSSPYQTYTPDSQSSDLYIPGTTDFLQGSSTSTPSSMASLYTPSPAADGGSFVQAQFDYGSSYVDVSHQPNGMNDFGDSLSLGLSGRSYSEQPLQGPFYEEQPVSRYLKSAPPTPGNAAFPRPVQASRSSHRLSFPNEMNPFPQQHQGASVSQPDYFFTNEYNGVY
jgi:hypothetical protein